jgi:hypothetical protein
MQRTGRNQRFTTPRRLPETSQRFYRAADDLRAPLGELRKREPDALEVVGLQKVAEKRSITPHKLFK